MRKGTRMMLMQNGMRRNREREGGTYAGYGERPIGFDREGWDIEARRVGRPRRNEPRMDGRDDWIRYDGVRNGYGREHDGWEMMPGGYEYGEDEEDDDRSGKKHKHFDGNVWVRQMKNADGTTGPHWDKQKAEELRLNRNMQDVEPEAFYIALNMFYSDYQPTLKKFGVDRPEVYAEFAKAFLTDKDGKKGMEKLKAYYCGVVK